MSNVITPEGRLAYPALVTPQEDRNGKGDPKYGTTLIFDASADLSELKAAALACAEEKFPGKAKQMIQNRQLKWPFRDNAEREGKSGFVEGGYFISARSKNRPGMVDQDLQLVMDPESVYGGRKARLSLRPFYYDSEGNKGVSFALQNVMLLADDGTRYDGRIDAENDFAKFRADAGGKAASKADILGL